MQPGEISDVIEAPEGVVVFKCDGRIPPDTSVSFEEKKPDLVKEVIEKRTQAEIARAFNEMKEQARPKLLLEGATS